MTAAARDDAEQEQRRLERRLAREMRARAEAEELLERKARELYEANQDLEHTTCALAAQVRALETERERIERMARTDSLTGLLNRAAFADALESAVGDPAHHARPLALFAVDLDRFKAINDSRGHAAGDLVLRRIAARLAEIAGPDGYVGRMGGDEFQLALWLPPAAVEDVCQSLHEALHAPIPLDGGTVVAGGSVGVALRPMDAAAIPELQIFADLALYVAKRRGGGAAARFDPSHYAAERRRCDLQEELRQGVGRGELEPWFQPIVPNGRGDQSLPALEILARWIHPTRGLIYPGEFIPLAEEGGFAGQITEAVLFGASEALIEWAASDKLHYATCNISMLEFQERRFAARFIELAQDLRLPLDRLALEITETCLCEQPSLAREHLQRLSAVGLRTAIDDFGTGYSNLRALMDLPVDCLKLDRSLIAGLGVDRRSTEILHGVLRITRGLGLSSIAEGVERPGQAAILRAAGCDMLQGFLFSKPMNRSGMDPWLAQDSGGA